jgi:hypothetical protein
MVDDPVELMRRAAEAEQAPAPAASGDSPLAGAVDYVPPPAPRAPTPPYTGQIFPFRKDETGDVTFDPDAGLLGAIRKPFIWSHDVRTGAIPADPRNPAYIGGAVESALTYGPGAVASRVGRGGLVAPGSEALDTASAAGFDAYRNSGQMYGGDQYRQMLQDAAQNLLRQGFHDVPDSAQLQHRIIQQELDRVKNAPFVTSQDVDALRVQLGGGGLRGPTAAANQSLRSDVFNFVDQNLPPNSPASVRDAVGNYRQARHSEAITGKDEAQSQLNIAKARGPELSAEQQRTNIARLVNKIEAGKGEGRGFSDTEANILRSANRATPGIDRAQRVGDVLSPTVGGGGLFGGLGSAGTALATGHPAVAAGLAAAATVPAAVGIAARSYANRGARRIAEDADNAIRMQSPLAQQSIMTLPSNFRATPGATPLSTASGGMIADAMEARRRELEARSQQETPPTYRVRPDGTVEEFT